MLLASAAHASEAADDTAESSDTGLLASVEVELDALSEEQAPEAAHRDSGLLGSVTTTASGTIERTAGDLVEKTGDTAEAGLDDVTSAVPGDSPGEPTQQEPQKSPAPPSSASAQPTSPSSPADPVQPRDQGYSGHGASPTAEARTSSPADSAAEAQPAPAPAERTLAVGDNDTDSSAENAPSTTSATGHTDPAPSMPALPSLPNVPSPPAGPATGMAHAQDGSQSGKQPGVLADAVTAVVRFEPVVAGGERATSEAGGIPARPGASPD